MLDTVRTLTCALQVGALVLAVLKVAIFALGAAQLACIARVALALAATRSRSIALHRTTTTTGQFQLK